MQMWWRGESVDLKGSRSLIQDTEEEAKTFLQLDYYS